MNIKFGIIMDSISKINIKKDSSFAILLEAQKRKYTIYYMEINDLYLKNNQAYAKAKILTVTNKVEKQHFHVIQEKHVALSIMHVIFMRKDPPINMQFIYATYILEIAESAGVLVLNKPKSLRDCNEKLYTNWFPSLIPNTLVSSQINQIKEFLHENKDIILKPLNSMGGDSIFRLTISDPNVSVVLEVMTKKNNNFCLAQTYIPEIKNGDKRIIIIDGKAIPWCLTRIPKSGETRGNLAAGGLGKIEKLNEHDLKITQRLSTTLNKKGLIFVGLDIIGNKLTEINVTSPTGICEIQSEKNISITELLLNAVEKKIYEKQKI
ncbi:Glutathione synthetase [Buchnera aphidicola (Eriosoma lanigerum)]|uniref:glutathione synthase n=1 Tax=Buchnera aphidicola TaxID=9 RepID=UPI003A751CF0